MADLAPKEISRDDVRLLVRRGAQLVEVLPREEYDQVHLAKATSIPLAMIGRNTADRLQWDKAVIVYSRNNQCDVSARAASRLAGLGFTQVYRYTAGKADWLANGLPVEGTESQTSGAGDVADLDVPTCKRNERVGEVRQRVQSQGWNTCVVVNDDLVVLGLLRAVDFEKADQSWPAEEAMDRDPYTVRLNAAEEEIKDYLHNNSVEGVLVTFTDGKLFGLIKRETMVG